jgi:hypothetical protein
MPSDNGVMRSAYCALLAALLILPACSINVKDKKEGNDAKVDIKTPLGDLHVNEGADIRDTGLTLYPGARPAPKDASDDRKSADVNLSFGGYGLKVVAAEFVSDASSEKIVDYYNKELQHFGKPIECHGNWKSRNDGANTDEGGLSKPVSCRESSGDSVELKVGTEGNQHIVAVKSDGKATRFALVYIRMHTGKDDTI